MARPLADLPSKKTKRGYEYAYFRGREHYLGKAGSDAARAAWANLLRRCAENPAAAGLDPADMLVPELFAAYLAAPDGPASRCRRLVVRAMTLLANQPPPGADVGPTPPDHRATPAAEFTPPAFKSWRRWLTEITNTRDGSKRYSATFCRQLTWAVLAAFRWGVSEGHVPPGVYDGLAAAAAVPTGDARPNRKIIAADPAHLDAMLPHLHPAMAAAVRLLRLTAARPSELFALTPGGLLRAGVVEVPGFGRCDLDRVGVWVLPLDKHKTVRHGKYRAVWFTPDAQAVLTPWLDGIAAGEAVFSPAREQRRRNARKRAARKSKLRPCDFLARTTPRQILPYGAVYTANHLTLAMRKACDAAGIPRVTAYQLRHLAKREITDRYGTEAARVMLGHTRTDTTDLYGGLSFKLVERIAADQK